jgi:uncharacterized SAM-binding protein YcdF (DUF218 family)
MSGATKEVLVVLGCKVRAGTPSAALLRRLGHARRVSEQNPTLLVIFSGGRAWDGVKESTAMAHWWRSHGTLAPTLEEDQSQTTLQNAREVGKLCRARGTSRVHLVTCDFHMARAAFMFKHQMLAVVVHPAPSPGACGLRNLREWGARCLSPFEMLLR